MLYIETKKIKGGTYYDENQCIWRHSAQRYSAQRYSALVFKNSTENKIRKQKNAANNYIRGNKQYHRFSNVLLLDDINQAKIYNI